MIDCLVDCSFNIIIVCLDVLGGAYYIHVLMLFKKYRKGDNVKALIKTSICENLDVNFSKKVRQIAAFAVLFLFFSDQTIA